MNKFLVISILNNFSLIQSLETSQVYSATMPKSVFKISKLMTGDIVEAEIIDENNASITNVLERKNFFFKPNVSNIDHVIIIMSLVEPKFDHLLLNKLIYNFEIRGIKPSILFTKIDLYDDKNNDWYQIYTEMGYETFKINQLEDNIESLTNWIQSFKGIVLVTGKSGTGKSTFTNTLIKDKSQIQKIDKISHKLQQGKNTTTNCKIVKWNENISIIDTPGFSKFYFDDAVLELDLFNGFHLFREYKDTCEFSNCSHTHETKCNIKQQVDKKVIPQFFYDDYVIIILELLKRKVGRNG